MKPKARFIASIVRTANEDMPALPFQRGARRAEFIAKRTNKERPAAKSA